MCSSKVSVFLCLMLAGTVQVCANLDPVHAKLFKLVQSGNRKQMNILLKKCSNVDVNKLNENNKTVLDIAVEARSVKMAADLLKYDAKVTTNQNAAKLKSLLDKQDLKYFLFGFALFLFCGLCL
ncbi:hypothetical protein KBD08_02825 [Candidatus Babeliales bacterium]|nr:hypothetical protein [Candidatus Babeliales bacterium]